VPWEETVLDAIAAMEGVAFAIHAAADTIVSGEIDISATMRLPMTDYGYISGRIRPDRFRFSVHTAARGRSCGGAK
jgi:hypothetical protein